MYINISKVLKILGVAFIFLRDARLWIFEKNRNFSITMWYIKIGVIWSPEFIKIINFAKKSPLGPLRSPWGENWIFNLFNICGAKFYYLLFFKAVFASRKLFSIQKLHHIHKLNKNFWLWDDYSNTKLYLYLLVFWLYS